MKREPFNDGSDWTSKTRANAPTAAVVLASMGAKRDWGASLPTRRASALAPAGEAARATKDAKRMMTQQIFNDGRTRTFHQNKTLGEAPSAMRNARQADRTRICPPRLRPKLGLHFRARDARVVGQIKPMGARGRPICRRSKGAHEREIAKTGRAEPTEEEQQNSVERNARTDRAPQRRKRKRRTPMVTTRPT